MAWIESHQTLARHPKVIRLANILRVHKAQAIGHLHLLWWWTLDYAPTGDVSVFASCELCAAAEWTGDAEKFKSALVESGWIDSDEKIHDWQDYAGKLVEQREADRRRKRVQRASGGHPADIRRMSGVPNPTQPNPTNKAAAPPAVVEGGIEEFMPAAYRIAEKLTRRHELRPPDYAAIAKMIQDHGMDETASVFAKAEKNRASRPVSYASEILARTAAARSVARETKPMFIRREE